jgi:Ca2+-binding EF-hand superfamily protein
MQDKQAKTTTQKANSSDESLENRPITAGLTKNLDKKFLGDEAEAAEYLKKHRLQDVLSIMTSSLVYSRPYNSRRHMSTFLKELKEIRDNYSEDRSKLVPHGPADPLFTDETLSSLFQTADVNESGRIPISTALSLANVIGVEKSEELFKHCGEIITKTHFITILQEALLRKTAAFYDQKEKYRTKL